MVSRLAFSNINQFIGQVQQHSTHTTQYDTMYTAFVHVTHTHTQDGYVTLRTNNNPGMRYSYKASMHALRIYVAIMNQPSNFVIRSVMVYHYFMFSLSSSANPLVVWLVPTWSVMKPVMHAYICSEVNCLTEINFLSSSTSLAHMHTCTHTTLTEQLWTYVLLTTLNT